MILSHIVAALSAFVRSVQYAGVLGISQAERVRYVKKSIRLALCYAGFGAPWNVMEAWKAGEAAFLSCAYDVVTDWRHYEEKARSAFERILTDLSPLELRELALTLYDKDLNNQLSEDGLERGDVALRFILKTMGCEKQREAAWGDLTDLGELLQIVDDVLDYEDDVAADDQNCLRTANRAVYLGRLLEGLNSEKTQRLFGRSRSVLVFAIAQARKKGTKLLAKTPVDWESEFPRNYSV
jgi:hypothetical protein